MFDLAWSEIALIAIVALLVIGPKDLPAAIRGIADGIKKLRKMAGEFQQQADELVKEAKLDELRNQIQDVRSTISDIRNFDLRTEIEKHVDKDGTLRATMTDTMGEPWTPPAAAAPTAPVTPVEAPAFVPPSVVATTLPPPPPKPSAPPPAFVPPSYAPPEPVNYTPVSAPPPVVAAPVAAPPTPAPSMIPPANTSAEPARAAGAV